MRKFLNKHWGWTFLIIPSILRAILFYFPMFQGAFYSFTNWTGLTYNLDFVGISNYKVLMTDSKFFKALGFTLILTLALIMGEVVIGIWIARALGAKIKGQTFFRVWFFSPAVLSGLTVSLTFKQVFNYGLPVIGEILNIEFLRTSLLRTSGGAIFAIIFVILWQGAAMPVILFPSGFQTTPSEVTEAAAIDGADDKQTFWNIELLYLSPSISMVFIMALKAGLIALDRVFALTGGGPSNPTTSIGLLVYNHAFSNNQYGYANAIALILSATIVLVSVLQLKSLSRFEV